MKVFTDINQSKKLAEILSNKTSDMYYWCGEDIDLACETNCIGYADVYQPIPLTPEILEKNGFELRDGFFYHRIDDKPHHYDFKLENGGVFTSEGYTLQCCIYHLTIRYVHELQHALRLCRLNDLADNIKLEEVK